MRKAKLTFGLLLIMTIVTACTPEPVQKELSPNEFTTKGMTYWQIAEELQSRGVKYPTVAAAQVVLESGRHSSDIFKENRNIFGMKFARKRDTHAIGVNRGHAVYSSEESCIDDYVIWQNYQNQKHFKSKTSYLVYIDRVYAEDKQYKTKLLSIMKKYNAKLN